MSVGSPPEELLRLWHTLSELDEKIVYVQQKLAAHKQLKKRPAAVARRFSWIREQRQLLLDTLLEQRRKLILREIDKEVANHQATMDELKRLLVEFDGTRQDETPAESGSTTYQTQGMTTPPLTSLSW